MDERREVLHAITGLQSCSIFVGVACVHVRLLGFMCTHVHVCVSLLMDKSRERTPTQKCVQSLPAAACGSKNSTHEETMDRSKRAQKEKQVNYK